jgi:hypothetical protein
MTTQNNTGILNSRAYINDYARSLRTVTQPAQPSSNTLTLCQFILDKIGEQGYDEWLATTPDDNEGFEKAVGQKFTEVALGR